MNILTTDQWQTREKEHSNKVLPWVQDFQARSQRGEKHPVYDFLFEYYQTNRRKLTEWRPTLEECLQGVEAEKFLKYPEYSKDSLGVYLNPEAITERLAETLQWVLNLLESAKSRPENTACFGLHEWAMLYKTESPRHTTPLRVSDAELARVVESHPIRCSHYDAFRFFTPKARPLNTLQPRHEDRAMLEQHGCIHYNMDLYKWCYKLHPWVSSELTADCFLLAIKAREFDMRASPYDVSEHGFEPIKIETPAGKREYQAAQKQISTQGRELAERLIAECKLIIKIKSKITEGVLP